MKYKMSTANLPKQEDGAMLLTLGIDDDRTWFNQTSERNTSEKILRTLLHVFI